MKRKSMCILFSIAAVAILGSRSFSQQKLNHRRGLERLVCVVPMIGAGTFEDPRRPAYAPLPGKAPARQDMLAYSYQISDDGQNAIVEYVAADRAALKLILEDSKKHPLQVRVFEGAKQSRTDMQRELRQVKRDFDIEKLGEMLP